MINQKILCATSVATWLAASGALAQEDTTSTAADTMLEEIVISAERREAKVQDIAIAITAITGDGLDDKAVKRLEDLQFAAPGLTVTSAGITQAVNIRGVGLASGSPSVTNGVASYIDGLFQPPIVSTNSFYDIADVTVFRGPQGTFVGSSSTGGAIFISSKNPQLGAWDGYVNAELGNYAQTGLQGALNVPVGETLALRGAINHARRDSFYDDHGVVGNEAARLDELSGRLGVLWEPADAFRALLKVEYSDKQTGGFAMRPVPTTAYAAGRIGGIRDLNYDTPTRNAERQLINSLELRYTTAGGIVFRSLSGYQDKEVHNLTDIDAASLPDTPATRFRRQVQDVIEKVTTEEINVISPTDGRWDWILGAYYQHNEIDVVNLNFVGAATVYPQRIYIPTDKTVQGYFGQLGFQATETVEILLGLRGNMFEGKQLSGAGIYTGYGNPATPNGTRIVDLEGSHDDSKPTGKLSVNWKINPDNLLYGFVARGYKPGGFNSATSEFDPETVTDIELGWKSTLFDGRMRTAINVFNYDYQNFQAAVIDLGSGGNNVTNVADAKIKGFELELQAQLGQVRIDGGLAYVDSELGSLTFVNTRLLPGPQLGPQCASGQTTGCFNYTPFLQTNTGGVNLYSPKWTYNVGVEYRIPLGNDSTLTPRLNYAYVDSQYVNLLYNNVTDLLASRGLLSALITYAREKWDVQLYGTNLSDEEYVAGQLGNNEFYGAPRQYGVRGSVRF